MRFFILCIALCIALGVAIVQQYALSHYWYWIYWWLDSVMHFSGGVLLALLAWAGGVRRPSLLLIVVISIGLLWELFEITIGISISEPNFLSDTALDLIMDALGGLVVYGMMRWWQPFRSPVARGALPDQTSSSR